MSDHEGLTNRVYSFFTQAPLAFLPSKKAYARQKFRHSGWAANGGRECGGVREGPHGSLFAALTRQDTPVNAAVGRPVNALCGLPLPHRWATKPLLPIPHVLSHVLGQILHRASPIAPRG